MDPDLPRLAAAVAADAVALRRDLHRHPEVAWAERRSTYRVANALAGLGLDPKVRPEGIGVVAEVGSGGPVVGWRADLDALPIHEENDVPYRSRVDGVMHACGHDVHTAVAVGIADALTRLDDLPGRVRFLFQPAEEVVPGGALAMRAQGAHLGLEALVALHVDPKLPPGRLGLREGPITSASDKIHLRLHGPGGHTSRPHETVDLVNVAARVVLDLPTRLRALVDPRRTLVLVFGRIAGGGTDNAIPTSVELGGTVRVHDLELWEQLPGLVERVVTDLVGPSGARVELEYHRGSPAVVNDPHVVAIAREAVTGALGIDAVVGTHRSLGAEDFSWYLLDVPGAMLRLGARPSGRPATDLHSATFDVDEAAIETGIAAGTAIVIDLLRRATDPPR